MTQLYTVTVHIYFEHKDTNRLKLKNGKKMFQTNISQKKVKLLY